MGAKLWRNHFRQMAKPDKVLLAICMRETKEGGAFIFCRHFIGNLSGHEEALKPWGCEKKEASLTSYDVCWDLHRPSEKAILSKHVFLFFVFFASPQHMQFPGQGSDPSRSCEWHCSCGKARFFTQYAELGIKPESQTCRDTGDPVSPQQNPVTPQRKCLWAGFRTPMHHMALELLWQTQTENNGRFWKSFAMI